MEIDGNCRLTMLWSDVVGSGDRGPHPQVAKQPSRPCHPVVGGSRSQLHTVSENRAQEFCNNSVRRSAPMDKATMPRIAALQRPGALGSPMASSRGPHQDDRQGLTWRTSTAGLLASLVLLLQIRTGSGERVMDRWRENERLTDWVRISI